MQRIIESNFTEQLKTNKIILLSGPPSVGKMPFAEKCLQQLGVKYEVVDFKNKKIRKKFSQLTEEEMRWYFNQFQFVVIGNAQLFESLQQVLNEVLSENIKASVILSCAFEPPIIEELKEALKWEGLDYYLPAPTYYELTQIYGMAREDQRIEHRLIFGNYPQIADFPENAAELLLKIVDETIATQLGVEDRVNKKAALMRTLQIAAHLVGEAISYNQIAEKIGVDNETVQRYLELLQKAHILFLLPSYHTEQKYELKKLHFVYFADNGIRNALINNFNPLSMRMDEDALWKNWLIAERIKWNKMNGKNFAYYFWRSHTRQQIDFIELQENQTTAYRFILDKKKKMKNPPLFGAYYPKVLFKSINRTGYLTFLTQK